MPKQNPDKTLMWSFINLNREGKADELLLFLQSNPGFKMEKSEYSDGQSFSFGRNIFYNIELLPYIDNLAAVKTKLAEGFVFGQTQRVSHQKYINSEILTGECPDEKVSEKKEMDFLQFDKTLKYFLADGAWTLEGRQKFLSNYCKLPAHYRENETILEHAKALKSSPILWEKFFISLFKKNLNLINLLIKEQILNVNEQMPQYLNTLLHHYCFYETALDTQFLQLCKDSGFNPNIKNSFEQNVLYMLIEKDNIDGALKFLDVFKNTINVNEKCKGKTYLHKVILQLEKYNKMNYNSNSVFSTLLGQYTQLFLELIKLQPSVEIRSGEKSKGTSIISYIEKKISDKSLSESLKSKMLIELEFSKIETKSAVKKFKI